MLTPKATGNVYSNRAAIYFSIVYPIFPLSLNVRYGAMLIDEKFWNQFCA